MAETLIAAAIAAAASFFLLPYSVFYRVPYCCSVRQNRPLYIVDTVLLYSHALQAGDVDDEEDASDVSGSDTPSELLDDDDIYDDDDVRQKTIISVYILHEQGELSCRIDTYVHRYRVKLTRDDNFASNA